MVPFDRPFEYLSELYHHFIFSNSKSIENSKVVPFKKLSNNQFYNNCKISQNN